MKTCGTYSLPFSERLARTLSRHRCWWRGASGRDRFADHRQGYPTSGGLACTLRASQGGPARPAQNWTGP